MTLASSLASALDAALRDADTVADDVLLSRDLKPVAEGIARRHMVETVRLHRVILDVPLPTKMAVPGDPGREEHVVVRGTAVELFVTLDGVATMALAGDDNDDLHGAGVRVDAEGGRLVVRYASQHPMAQAANQYFAEALRIVETVVETVNKQVGEFNAALEPAVRRELDDCKDFAEQRKKFAAGLKLPESYGRWWGRPG